MFDSFSGIFDKARTALSTLFTPQQTVAPQSPLNYTPAPQPFTPAPNMSTNLGPARGNQNGTITLPTGSGAVTVPKNVLSPNQTPFIPGFTSSAPKTTTIRQATPSVPMQTPYSPATAGSSYVPPAQSTPFAPPPPPQAQSGTAGTSTGFSSMTPLQGAMGTAGSTPATSRIGAGPLGSFLSPNSGVSSEEERRKQGVQSVQSPFFGPVPFSSSMIPGPTAHSTPSMEQGVFANIMTPILNSQSAKMTSEPLPGTIDAGTAEATKGKATSTLTQARTTGSTTTLRENNQANLAAIAEKADAVQNSKSLGQAPVEDTRSQQEFFETLPPDQAFNYKAAADRFKMDNGYSELLKAREAASSAIVATTQFYRDLIDEVRSNPNLPRGVKNARIGLLEKQQKAILDRAQQDMNTYQNSLDAIDRALDSQLGIQKAQSDENENIRKRNMDMFGMLVENGAEFSDDMKKQWSSQLGIPESQLASIVKGKSDIHYQESNGVIYQFDKSGKLLGTFGSPTSTGAASFATDSQYSDLIRLVTRSGSTNQDRAGIAADMSYFLQNGSYGSANALMNQATGRILKGETATKFQQRVQSFDSLNDLQATIQAYSDAGGDMNILKGSADFIQTRIGKLMTDKKYAAIAAQMDAAFQNYRQEMTGAAFGAAESSQYASVLPDKSNNLDLNLAKLSGARSYLDSQISATLRQTLGEQAVEIRKLALGGSQTGGQSADDALAAMLDSGNDLPDEVAQENKGFFSSIWGGIVDAFSD